MKSTLIQHDLLSIGRSGFLKLFLAVSALQGCSMVADSASDVLDHQARPMTIRVNNGRPQAGTSTFATTGTASWYGPGFHGKRTASGEIFDKTKFTAAHKTLPLGSRAKVTHLSNGKSVEVLINDRGPYVEGRIIDLSEAAAEALGIIDIGVSEVQIELLTEKETVASENVWTPIATKAMGDKARKGGRL